MFSTKHALKAQGMRRLNSTIDYRIDTVMAQHNDPHMSCMFLMRNFHQPKSQAQYLTSAGKSKVIMLKSHIITANLRQFPVYTEFERSQVEFFATTTRSH